MIMMMGKTGTHKHTHTHTHTHTQTHFSVSRVGMVIGRIYDNDDGENW